MDGPWTIGYGLLFASGAYFFAKSGTIYDLAKNYVGQKNIFRVLFFSLAIGLFLVIVFCAGVGTSIYSMIHFQEDVFFVKRIGSKIPSGTYSEWSFIFVGIGEMILAGKAIYTLSLAFMEGWKERKRNKLVSK